MQGTIILDANILIRAILGKKVREILFDFHQKISFITPDVCIHDAEKYLPVIFKKRKLSSDLSLGLLADISQLLQIIDKSIYEPKMIEAQKRMALRQFCRSQKPCGARATKQYLFMLCRRLAAHLWHKYTPIFKAQV